MHRLRRGVAPSLHRDPPPLKKENSADQAVPISPIFRNGIQVRHVPVTTPKKDNAERLYTYQSLLAMYSRQADKNRMISVAMSKGKLPLLASERHVIPNCSTPKRKFALLTHNSASSAGAR